nr:MAG TPA: minor structural protein [Caudoviricetes sp.]
MKREDVKNKIPGITDEQLNWIMQENGADINREKSAATALQTQLDNANAQLKTAQDGLKAFDGVDVAGLQEQVTKLKADMKAQAEGFAFDNALNAAILGKKGRSVKAVRALLDLDALKGSADRSTDIAKALDEAAKANPWAFGDVQDGEKKNAGTYSTGAEHGDPMHGEDDVDPVEASFKAMNPNIKI